MKNKKLISCGFPIFVTLLSVLIVVLFNYIVQKNIQNRAIDSLFDLEEVYGESDEVYVLMDDYDENYYFDVYVLSMNVLDRDMLLPTEYDLYQYYKRAKDNLEADYVYTYNENGKEIYFMLSGNEKDGEFQVDYLVYTNVTALIDTIWAANKVLAIVLFVVILVTVFVGNRIGHMIEENEKNLKNFFSNASHELKTPIMAIQGYAEGIETGVVEEKKAANVILKESDRMSNLVGDILELSKVDSGALRINRQNTDVREILYEIIDANEFNLKENSVALQFDLKESLMANCDETMIHSVLANIIDNTIRYAKQTVRLETRKIPNYLVIEISNDGRPIAEEEKKHIFDRFYKGEKGQTGIGMALSKEYMDLHRGTIKINTTECETIFVLEIPT